VVGVLQNSIGGPGGNGFDCSTHDLSRILVIVSPGVDVADFHSLAPRNLLLDLNGDREEVELLHCGWESRETQIALEI
jgi:hypothetical protein